MNFMLSHLTLLFLFLFSACSHLKSQKIQNEKNDILMTYLQGVGEGRGRLGVNGHQYLFSFDALLKENNDWILAANIPLHGEEVLLLSNLKKEKNGVEDISGLEVRIEQGIGEYLKSQKKSPRLAQVFLSELRSLMRLVLHQKLALNVECSETECKMGESIYQVKTKNQEISLKKSLDSEFEIEYVAMNLTDSIFKRSNVFLHSKNKKSSTPTLLSLELFWK